MFIPRPKVPARFLRELLCPKGPETYALAGRGSISWYESCFKGPTQLELIPVDSFVVNNGPGDDGTATILSLYPGMI